MDVRVAYLYPEHLNIYADRGNIAVLRNRARWRGIAFELLEMGPGAPLPRADLYYLGGGQDRDQLLVADDLAGKAGELRAAVDDGAAVLAVCGGYQLLGHRYRGHHGDDMPGTSLVDLETLAGDDRMIGNITLECIDEGVTHRVVGFENHAGRTYLGDGVHPLGRVLRGHGNNGRDGARGSPRRPGDRHLRARAASAQESVAGRSGAAHGARAPPRPAAARAARRRACAGRTAGGRDPAYLGGGGLSEGVGVEAQLLCTRE